MKNVFLLALLFLHCEIFAGEGYRYYLLYQTFIKHPTKMVSNQTAISPAKAIVPPYQIPKGNIFCRMEDKLTRATKVWIKIGVK